MPRGKSGQKEEQPPSKPATKRTTIAFPTAQYRALKIYCVHNEKEMSAVVCEALAKMGIEE